MSLPEPIVVDLFDVEYKPSKVAIDHIGDIIDGFGFQVENIDDYDIRLWFDWRLAENKSVKGRLIIDRMNRTFEITASNNEIIYTPLVTRNFRLVEKFLRLLEEDATQ